MAVTKYVLIRNCLHFLDNMKRCSILLIYKNRINIDIFRMAYDAN